MTEAHAGCMAEPLVIAGIGSWPMHDFSSIARTSVDGDSSQASGITGVLKAFTRPVRAASRAAVFFLKVFPMLPSASVDWVTESPVVERVTYPTRTGDAQGDLHDRSRHGQTRDRTF